jgi:hypothetical protein
MKAVSFIKSIDNQIEVTVGHFLASIGCYSLNERSKGSELSQLGRQESARITSLREFYMQEFLPQMIMQYFEGWSEGVKSNYHYVFISENNGKKFDYGFQIGDDFAVYFIKNEEFKTILPDILDDFIRDCERCGIPLVWKKEVVEKHFK